MVRTPFVLAMVVLCTLLQSIPVAEAAEAMPTATAGEGLPVWGDGPERDEPEGCAAGKLRGARVEASVRLAHDGRGRTGVRSKLTVRVPAGWPLSHHLLLSEDSGKYRHAVDCLFGGHRGHRRDGERTGPQPPVLEITPVKNGIRVRSVSSWSGVSARIAQLPDGGEFGVGPWLLRSEKGKPRIRLRPSEALRGADWRKITVDPGRPGAEETAPPPSTRTRDGALVWRPPDGEGRDRGIRLPEVTLAGIPGAIANGDEEPDFAAECATGELRDARAWASVRLAHDDRVHTKVSSELTVRVPSAWPLAHELLLGEDSEPYRRAMACLLRGTALGDTSGDGRYLEWRPSPPDVTPAKDGIRVRYRAYRWIDTSDRDDDLLIGPWRLRIGAERWRVRFRPSEALETARWEKITVDPGTPGAAEATPPPTTGGRGTALVWQPENDELPSADRRLPEITVGVDPGRWRSWSARSQQPWFKTLNGAGVLLYNLSLTVLLLTAARGLRRPRTSRAPDPGGMEPADPDGRDGTGTVSAFRNLQRWAWLSLALSVLREGDDVLFGWTGWNVSASLLLTLVPGLLLLFFARPPRPLRTAMPLFFIPPVAAVFLWLEYWPFPLPGAAGAPLSPGVTVLVFFVLQGCALGLCLLGYTAAGWRLARDGGLLRVGLRLRWAGPAAILLTVISAACYAAAAERNWQRVSWLHLRDESGYGTAHARYLADEAVWFAVNGQDWLLAYVWVLTGLAVLGALKASSGMRSGSTPGADSGGTPPDSPLVRRPERLLILVFFPAAVGIGLGWYANNAALWWIWLFVHMAALRLMTLIGTGRTVLGLPLEGTEEPLRATATPARRAFLLERARRYREIHAKLRRLDQGQSDDTAVERAGLEHELSGLHDWEDRQGAPRRLPTRISVVDAALALGPKDTWWANGKRGAVLATFFGVPATLVTTWASDIRGDAWTTALHYGFGLPDVLLAFFYWQFGWTGAGFLLGALWRVLPGRRGAARALPVAGAFALPIALDALVLWAMDESQDNLALYAAMMLLVLTCTGIAMDLETFRGEGRYWQSRIGLLLSVYQMRYLSLQIAYILVQVAGLIAVWEFFADTGGPPPGGPGDKNAGG
ncbi:DUF6185 family protein [Streptomyces xinghaiensis]|uniref:DUF6185 family protein n=1 Tax=Streptomyces xinghaiensis TaxID=1038928 RepID=UPI00341CF192